MENPASTCLSKIIADKILNEYNYPNDKKERVLDCVYNHRSSRNAESIEDSKIIGQVGYTVNEKTGEVKQEDWLVQ